jgi:hypothetical protein
VNIEETVKGVHRLAGEHKTALLTAVGVAGTVTTAVLTGRASFTAARLIDAEEQRRYDEDPSDGYQVMDPRDEIALVWSLYIPPVGVGALTIIAIVLAHKMDTAQAAAFATAYGVSERALNEYKEKVREKLGESKEKALRDEIAAERIQKDPVQDKQVFITNTGEVLCYDNISGRYFQSSVEAIKKAENRVNFELVHYNQCSLSFFYDKIGLPATRHSDEVGWNSNNLLEVNFSTQMSTDDRPCIVLDFTVGPTTNYANLY